MGREVHPAAAPAPHAELPSEGGAWTLRQLLGVVGTVRSTGILKVFGLWTVWGSGAPSQQLVNARHGPKVTKQNASRLWAGHKMLYVLQLLLAVASPLTAETPLFQCWEGHAQGGSPESLGVEQPFRTGYNSLQQKMLPFAVLLKGLLKPATCIL